jgi:hypothetical protein
LSESNALSLEKRQAILQTEIGKYVTRGYVVQSVSGTQAVLSRKKKIRVVTHIILALLTVGFWLIIPLIQIINRKQSTLLLTIDPLGNVRKD